MPSLRGPLAACAFGSAFCLSVISLAVCAQSSDNKRDDDTDRLILWPSVVQMSQVKKAAEVRSDRCGSGPTKFDLVAGICAEGGEGFIAR